MNKQLNMLKLCDSHEYKGKNRSDNTFMKRKMFCEYFFFFVNVDKSCKENVITG